MTDAFIYLVVAAILGVLFALVLSIRRLMNLEFKQEKLLNTIKRVELRDIAMEERTYKILKEIEGGTKKKKLSLKEQYEKETGKNAIWHGKVTKGFKEWKKKQEKK